jgi:hypothetical protein
MVDAPVSGGMRGLQIQERIRLIRFFAGVTGAKAGTLSFLVGGRKEAFTRASPILTLMGQRIIHCGPAGSGLAAKICNNLMLGVEQIVVAEAMLLGQRLGLDPAVLASVINSSTGACWSSSVNNPVPGALPEKSPPCERGFEGGFATELMIKVGDVNCLFYHKCTQSQRFFVVVVVGVVIGPGIGKGCIKSIGFTSAVDGSGGKDLCGRCETIPRSVEERFFLCVWIFEGEEIEMERFVRY